MDSSSGARKNYTTTYVYLGILVIVTATFPPAIFGDRVHDNWTKFVYDFQSLITGVLAIAAAYLTVYQMKDTDKEQGKRHDDLMALNIRSDALRLQRAEIPFVMRLGVQVTMLRDLFNNENTAEVPTPVQGIQARLQIRELVELLASAELDDAKSLFDASSHQSLVNLRKVGQRLQELGDLLDGMFSIDDATGEPVWKTNLTADEVKDHFTGITEETQKISYLSHLFATSLTKLSMLYNVKSMRFLGS